MYRSECSSFLIVRLKFAHPNKSNIMADTEQGLKIYLKKISLFKRIKRMYNFILCIETLIRGITSIHFCKTHI